MGNVIADRVTPELQMFVNHQVYAHVYAGAGKKVMLRSWKTQYRKFTKSLERAWSRKNRWVVQADIASYYDSINHTLLINRIRQWLAEDNLLDLLKECLRKWAPHKIEQGLNMGLPQGYETSDFLATLFLYPVDHELCEKGYDDKYRRYVDDIRLFLPTENKAKKALIELDRSLKSIGLILQTRKTFIERVDSIDTQRDPLGGILSLVDQTLAMHPRQTQEDLRSIFFDALDNLPDKFAERHSRMISADRTFCNRKRLF